MICELFSFVPECDIPNWLTMLLELMIGGIIAGWFFWRQKQQGDKVESVVTEIKQFEVRQQKIIDRAEQREENRMIEWGGQILDNLGTIKNYNEILRNWILVYNEHKTQKQKSNIIISAERLGGICDHFIQQIKENIPKVETLFSDPTLGSQLIAQSNSLSQLFFNMKEDYVWEKDSVEQIHSIENVIELLDKGIKRVQAEIPKISDESIKK